MFCSEPSRQNQQTAIPNNRAFLKVKERETITEIWGRSPRRESRKQSFRWEVRRAINHASPDSPLILLITGRTQYVRTAASRSISLAMLFGVPQDSVLGPTDQSCSSFTLLTCCSWWSAMDFIHTAMQTTLRSTGFATRRMLTHCKSVCWSALTKFSRGRCPTGCSLTLPRLELLWCSSARRQHQIPTGPVRVGDTSVQPVRTVRDLGVYIDADVTVSAHVTAVVKACFAALRQIRSRSVRRSLTRTTHLVDTSVCTCGDKGELLQLNSLGYFRTSVTTAAVCLQRRRSSRVLRKEVGAHISTSPWTVLAESSRDNSVPVMCSRVSLPYRHGAVMSCWNPPLNCRRGFTSASSECLYIDAGHTVHTTHHAGWSSHPGDCCSSVECSSVVCSFCAIAAAVPPRPQDGTACFSHRTLRISVQLCDGL